MHPSLAFQAPAPAVLSRGFLSRSLVPRTSRLRTHITATASANADAPRGAWDFDLEAPTAASPAPSRAPVRRVPRPARQSRPARPPSHRRPFDNNKLRSHPRPDYRRSAPPDEEDTANSSVVREAIASEDDLVYGVTPVLLALQACRRPHLTHLFLQTRASSSSPTPAGPSRKSDNAAALDSIVKLAKRQDIPVTHLPKGHLNTLASNRPHQGVVLQAARLDLEPLQALPKPLATQSGRPPCYLVLDEVTDPQNAGALIRSAYFLGAQGVVLCRRNSCALTPVVSKASAGAAELMTIHGVPSMPRFLRAARDDGWRVVGMASEPDATSIKSLNLDSPTLVVLGSEGSGLRTMVRQSCDLVVRIGAHGDHPDVDSLNVSVAGAVALYQLLAQ